MTDKRMFMTLPKGLTPTKESMGMPDMAREQRAFGLGLSHPHLGFSCMDGHTPKERMIAMLAPIYRSSRSMKDGKDSQ